MNKLELVEVKNEGALQFSPFRERTIIYNGEVRGNVLQFTDFKDSKYKQGYDILLDGKCFVLPKNVSLKKEIKRRIENATNAS